MSIGEKQTGWGVYMQGSQELQVLENMGSALSVALHCPIHFPSYGKNMFECKCGVTFPVFLVKAAMETKDWSTVRQIHNSGGRDEV